MKRKMGKRNQQSNYKNKCWPTDLNLKEYQKITLYALPYKNKKYAKKKPKAKFGLYHITKKSHETLDNQTNHFF